MKVYYAEHGIFPATYNFKDDAVDAVPAGWTTNNGAGCTTTIIASIDGHRKVLKLADTNAATLSQITTPTWTAVANNSIEVLFRLDDVTGSRQFVWSIIEDATTLTSIVINNNDLQYYDGAYKDIKANGVIVDIWHHLKIIPDDSANTFDCYLDGVLEGADLTYLNGSTTGHTKISFETRIEAFIEPYNCYIDALGIESDASYDIGDNRFVDFHDPYNKEEITNIIEYPTIIHRLDAYWTGGITIRDFEGALFSAWYGRNFNKILIEDDSSNILFRGFLTKKIFKKDSLALTFAGIGVLLDWKHFGSEGYISFILEEGLVKAPISSDSIIQLKDSDGVDWTWTPDTWIQVGRDLGITIVDKTTLNTRTWDSSAISQSNGSIILGNNASTITFNDGDYYAVLDASFVNNMVVITPIIDGVVIDSTTSFLKSIEVQYSFRLKMDAGPAWIKPTIYLEILKDTEWIVVALLSGERYGSVHTTGWSIGVPLSIDGGNGNEWKSPDDGNDTELQKYFNKTGNDYDELKGMRFRVGGQTDSTGSIEVHVDFINVIVGYMSDDISAIMESITDNTATAIACSDVSAWDEMGVIANDGFKIGENTRNVISEISNQLGLHVERIDNFGSVSILTYYPTGDGGTIQWTPFGGGDNWDELVDSSDATYVSTLVDNRWDYYTFDEINLRGGYVTAIAIWFRWKETGGPCSIDLKYSVDGGANWSDSKNADAPGAWTTGALNWTGLTEYDLSNFVVGLNSVAVAGGETIYVSELYVKFTISGSSFNKYMARKFKGAYCMEALEAVCKLEGAHWWEDYIDNKIVVAKLADFVDSTVDLTEANYGHDWVYEDECNQVKSFFVFGKSEDEIFAKAVDESVEGYISEQLIDETISNVVDAQDVADAQLALRKTKRPSLKITLNGVYASLQLGTTVHVTLERPTIAQVLYPIRKTERSESGAGIKTVIYCGMGESSIGEKIAKVIRDNAFRSHKALTDRLISP